MLEKFYTEVNKLWPEMRGNFWAEILVAIVFVVVGYFREEIRRFLSKKETDLSIAIRKYKESLWEDTFKLSHSWNPLGQTLKDIFIPINISIGEHTQRELLSSFISSKISKGSTIRILVLGDAGSGKTVALQYMIQYFIERGNDLLLPIFLKFTNIQDVASKAEFEEKIIESLEANQFYGRRTKNMADFFVKQYLYDWKVLLLIDGFDEVEKPKRYKLLEFLKTFFQSHQKLNFVISSRTSIYTSNQGSFAGFASDNIQMAELTMFEIRYFVSNWKFNHGKSPDELVSFIKQHQYLRAMVSRPLVLNMVTFLYGKRNIIFPKNRVAFFEEFVLAMFEKWNEDKLVYSNNSFDISYKRRALNTLAYRQIVQDTSISDEIDKRKVYETLKEFTQEKLDSLLNEILTSELLKKIPPDSYRFLHRSFTEFFTANYFYDNRNAKFQELIAIYRSDKGKWMDTLTMFCGINDEIALSNQIISELTADYLTSLQYPVHDTRIFKIALEIPEYLNFSQNKLFQLANEHLTDKFSPDVIEYIASLATSNDQVISHQSRTILYQLLNKKLTDEELQFIILKLVITHDPQIEKIILEYLPQIDVSTFLLNTGEEYATIFLENLPEHKYREVFSGLKNVGATDFIFNLIVQTDKDIIRQLGSLTLATTIKDSFRMVDTLGTFNSNKLNASLRNRIEAIYSRYGWPPFDFYNDENSQKAIFFICYNVAELKKNSNYEALVYGNRKEVSSKLRYLISAFSAEDGCSFYKNNIIDVRIKGINRGLVAHWKPIINLGPFSYSSVVLLQLAICFWDISGSNVTWAQMVFGIYVLFSYGIFSLEMDLNNMINKRFKKRLFDKNSENGGFSFFAMLLTPHLLLCSNIHRRSDDLPVRYVPSLCLFFGLILVMAIFMLPITFKYAIVNALPILILLLIGYASSTLSTLNKYFQNGPILALIDDEKRMDDSEDESAFLFVLSELGL